jgi:hypothetical protein
MNLCNPPYPHRWSSQFLIDESQVGADFDRDAFAGGWGVILGVRYCVPVGQHPAFDFEPIHAVPEENLHSAKGAVGGRDPVQVRPRPARGARCLSMAEAVGSIASTSRPTWPPYVMRRRQCAYPRLRHPHASVLVSAGNSLPIVAHGCALRACAQRSVTCRGHVGSILTDKKLGSVVPSRGRP